MRLFTVGGTFVDGRELRCISLTFIINIRKPSKRVGTIVYNNILFIQNGTYSFVVVCHGMFISSNNKI